MYRDAASNPGVVQVLTSQLTARFPFGMLSIILLLHIQLTQGDYTSAGIVLATQSVGQAVSGPLSGRLMGRWGMRPVLSLTTLLCSAMLVTIAFVHLPLVFVALIAFGIGILTPPVTPAVRTIYPKLVPNRQLTALFSLDATAQEIIWMLGPVIAVFVSSQFGTQVGLCVAAAFMALGGLWFVSGKALASVKLPKPKRGFGAVLRYPTVIIATIVGFFFVASFSAIEAGIVAAFSTDDGSGHGQGSLESGIILAVFAGGSLVGGFLFGHREVRPWSLVVRTAIVLAGTLACLVTLNMWWLCAVLFLGGLGMAPLFAALSNIVSATVKFSETAEAYGWSGTGQLVGVAVGSALGGSAIDHFGALGAIWVSAGLLVVAALCAAASIRWTPDLRDSGVVPPPETNTITLPLP